MSTSCSTQEELESVEPGRSRTIDISDFVDAAEIDPIYFQKSYYLAPSDETAAKAYSLLVKAMAKAERIGVATFVMRGKQYLAAIRPSDGTGARDDVLRRRGARLRRRHRQPPGPEPGRGQGPRHGGAPGGVAHHAVGSEGLPRYLHRARPAAVDAKKKNREIVLPETAEEAGQEVSSLLEALQASVDAAKSHHRGNTGKVVKLKTRKRDENHGDKAEKSSAKKLLAKKSSAKKSSAKKSSAKKSTAKKSTAKKSTAKKSTGGRSRRKAS